MIETHAAADAGDSEWAEAVTPFDAASYIHQLTREMAGLAAAAHLPKLAAALELACALAAENMDEAAGARF